MINKASKINKFIIDQYALVRKSLQDISHHINSILIVIIFAMTILVTYLTYIHNPNFEFDESNTIRISQSTSNEINEILSYEQNFPFYYQTVHNTSMILNLPVEVIGKTINYCAWLLSLFIVYYILKALISNTKWILFGTIIWTATPMLSYYAYFFRMYAVFFTIINLQILILIQLTKQKQQVFHLIFTLNTILLAKLHPSSIIALPILLITYYLVVPQKWLLKILLTILPSYILLNEILQKKDIYLTYLGQGVLYIKNTVTPFYWAPSLLIYNEDLSLAPILYITLITLSYIMLKRKFWQEKSLLPVSIFIYFFSVFHIINRTFVNSRHYIFFSTPLIIFITFALSKSPPKYKAFLSITTIIYFLSINYGNLLFFHYKENNYNKICNIVKNLEQTKIYLDWGTLNGVAYCNINNNPISFLTPNLPTETGSLSQKDIIIQQVKLGGLYWFRNAGINGMTKELKSLEIALNNEPPRQPIALIKDYHYNPYLTAQEIKATTNLQFVEYKDPSVFIFKSK